MFLQNKTIKAWLLVNKIVDYFTIFERAYKQNVNNHSCIVHEKQILGSITALFKVNIYLLYF